METENGIALDIAMTSFLLDCTARRLSPKTVEYYENTVGPFCEFAKENDVDMVEGVKSHLIRLILTHRDDWSAGTVHAYARGIRSFFNYCVREEWLIASPMRNVRMPKKSQEILPSFTEEEFQKILKACDNSRDKAMCLFMVDTGVRVSELVNIIGEDIDLFGGTVRIRRARFTGTPLTIDGAKMIMRKLKLDSGVKHCHAHTFRRTFAIWSLRNGMNVYVLQRLMGHTDLTVLRR